MASWRHQAQAGKKRKKKFFKHIWFIYRSKDFFRGNKSLFRTLVRKSTPEELLRLKVFHMTIWRHVWARTSNDWRQIHHNNGKHAWKQYYPTFTYRISVLMNLIHIGLFLKNKKILIVFSDVFVELNACFYKGTLVCAFKIVRQNKRYYQHEAQVDRIKFLFNR